jgi:predicted nucleic acid-binding Zn ribbon protein
MSFKRDWKCPKCGVVSPDVPTDIPDQYCPFCGGVMDRVYTPPLILFHGHGWTPRFGKKEN